MTKTLRNIKLICASLGAAFSIGFSAVTPAHAFDIFPQCTSGTTSSTVCAGRDSQLIGQDSLLERVIGFLILIVGVASVIMIVIGGFRYVLSGGDSAGTTSAKNTIIYAVVGLVVSMIAYGILNFVIANI